MTRDAENRREEAQPDNGPNQERDTDAHELQGSGGDHVYELRPVRVPRPQVLSGTVSVHATERAGATDMRRRDGTR